MIHVLCRGQSPTVKLVFHIGNEWQQISGGEEEEEEEEDERLICDRQSGDSSRKDKHLSSLA